MSIFGEQSIFSLRLLDENHGRKRKWVIHIYTWSVVQMISHDSIFLNYVYYAHKMLVGKTRYLSYFYESAMWFTTTGTLGHQILHYMKVTCHIWHATKTASWLVFWPSNIRIIYIKNWFGTQNEQLFKVFFNKYFKMSNFLKKYKANFVRFDPEFAVDSPCIYSTYKQL
jgi:hypothetical protein